MARGLLHGAATLAVTTLVCTLFACFAPMWHTKRVELEESQCWLGQGLWQTNFYFGDSHVGDHTCDGYFKNTPSLSTHDAYCNENLHPSWHDSPTYNHDMCSTTRYTKGTSTIAWLCALTSSIIALVMCTRRFRRRYEWLATLIALAFICVSFVASLTTVLIYGQAAIWSHQHIKAENKESNGMDFIGYASCSFQTPLRHPITGLLGPAPLWCIIPGPAMMVELMSTVTASLSAFFYVQLVRDIVRKEGVVITTEAAGNDDIAPLGLRRVRRYSIYGAFARRLASLSVTSRFLAITFIPFASMVTNAITWLAFLMTGIQVIGGGRFSIVPMSQLHSSQIPVSNATAEMLQPYIVGMLGEQYYHNDPTKPILLLADPMNFFNFSPMTSTTYFWRGSAKLIALASAISIFLIPVTKVWAWIALFYSAVDEVTRGRMLTFIDFTGKIQLANLYVISFVGISLTFTRDMVFPWWLLLGIIPKHTALVIEIKGGMNCGDGFGSWMYVLTSILSLLIGQVMVLAHTFASSWEEERRARHGLRDGARYNGPASQRPLDTPLLLHSGAMLPSLTTPLVGVGGGEELQHQQRDAEHEDEHDDLPGPLRTSSTRGSSMGAEGAPSLQPSSTSRTLLHHFASFGSNTDLQHLSRNMSHDESTQRLKQLASYGSRVGLVNMVEEANEPDYVSLEASPRESSRPPKALHPYCEAMCDRVLSPLQGVRIKWTPRGKIVLWLILFVHAGFILICQSWDLFRIHMQGFIGDLIVPQEDKFKDYSLVTLAGKIPSIGWHAKGYELGGTFFIMTGVMPTLHLLGLAMLWTIPLTLRGQIRLFTWLEVASAWTSLDIFLLVCIIMIFELKSATTAIIGDAVPGLSHLQELVLPFVDGIFGAEMKILPGFGVFVVAVVFEKIASYLLMESCVSSIAERQAENTLRSAFGANVSQSQSGIISDAAEGLLETDAGLFFGPAARYTSTLLPKRIYAGLPRTWWLTVGVRFGLLADADKVDRYQNLGVSSGDATRRAMPRTSLMPEDDLDTFVLTGSGGRRPAAFSRDASAFPRQVDSDEALLTAGQRGSSRRSGRVVAFDTPSSPDGLAAGNNNHNATLSNNNELIRQGSMESIRSEGGPFTF